MPRESRWNSLRRWRGVQPVACEKKWPRKGRCLISRSENDYNTRVMPTFDNHQACSLSRRQWMQLIGLSELGLALFDGTRAGAAAQEPAAKNSLVPLNRFPRMVQEHFVDSVRSAEEAGLAAKARLQTRADAEAYVAQVRHKIQQCFGQFPEKTPLNPRVAGVVERDAYRIEKVIFESRPRFFVTANLYVPNGEKIPLPGVVGSCGHSDNGKAAETYQSFAQGLARMGYWDMSS